MSGVRSVMHLVPRTPGYRGRHVCGVTLLSMPPNRTVLVGAAHCNYICKDLDGTILETCCCRNPDTNFASCRTTSSYCGVDGRLGLAEATDLLVVCGEWSLGQEPELYSREREVVMPVTKLINHPRYSAEQGPGEGYDIAVYHVDDTRLRQGVHEEVLPACLPEQSQVSVGSKGILAAFKDPLPLSVYYLARFDRTVKKYRADELILRHTRMDVVECGDPAWMASHTFYPRGVLCARDPSAESCLDSGDSGSGLVMPRGDGTFSWVGTLSFYKGCDRAKSQFQDEKVSNFHGENPGVFSSGVCYLPWIARQYGLTFSRGSGQGCEQTTGNREDRDKTECVTFNGRKCDFASKFVLKNYYNNLIDHPVDDPRNITFTECHLGSLEGFTQLAFLCPLDATTLAICPNNCLGVRASAIVAGGTALLAATAATSFSLLQAVVGLSAMAVSGGMLAQNACMAPVFCRARSGQCCLVRGSTRGLVCPRTC